MTKAEALEKYKKQLSDFDYMGISSEWLERINTDKLTEFAVSTLARDFYELDEIAQNFRNQLGRIESYKDVVNQLTTKNHTAILALTEIVEMCSMDEGHRMAEIAQKALKRMDSTIS